MKKTKHFDCVEMKRKGAEGVMKELEGLSLSEQLQYWKNKEEESRQREATPQANSLSMTPEAFRLWMEDQVEAFEKEQGISS